MRTQGSYIVVSGKMFNAVDIFFRARYPSWGVARASYSVFIILYTKKRVNFFIFWNFWVFHTFWMKFWSDDFRNRVEIPKWIEILITFKVADFRKTCPKNIKTQNFQKIKKLTRFFVYRIMLTEYEALGTPQLGYLARKKCLQPPEIIKKWYWTCLLWTLFDDFPLEICYKNHGFSEISKI